jgi:glutamyl-tRNA synthetase
MDDGITHVIRGVDHVSNTPKQIQILRALGHEPPVYAHAPDILGDDGKKLSKRHGAQSVDDFRAAGYVPEALVNFLALLGWAPGGDREVMSRAEMEREFTLEKVGASPSVFDPEKLLWMNSQYMASLPEGAILERAAPFAGGAMPPPDVAAAAVALHRTRARTAEEMGRALASYAKDPETYDADGMKKQVKPETPAQLSALIAAWKALPDWSVAPLEEALRKTAEGLGVSAGKLIHPVRLALTGVTVGAPLFDVAALLGKETSLRRLEAFTERITTAN